MKVVVGLTLSRANAYRSLVRCRPVPHVHGQDPWGGGASRRAPSTARKGITDPRESTRSHPERDTREQAHLPAEQPSPSQGAWIPTAHADPCWPRHHLRPPSQGPQDPDGLSGVPQPIAVLPAAHRLSGADEFRRAVRTGERAGGRLVVVHRAGSDPAVPARVGLVVSRSVGNSVVRNLVKRRLRHLVAVHLDALSPGDLVVLRAQPAAAAASYAELGRELTRCLARVGLPTGSGAP